MQSVFPGRAAFNETVLVPYRVPVFDAVAPHCTGGAVVAAGEPLPRHGLSFSKDTQVAKFTPVCNRWIMSGRLEMIWQSRILRWLEDSQPDVLTIDANPRLLSARREIRWMHRRGKPVMGWGLGVMPLSSGLEAVRSWGRRRFVQSFDGMIAYSTRAAEQYHALGIPQDRIFVARNAATRRPTSPPPRREVRHGEPPTVIYVGQIIPWKRVDNLLWACAALPANLQPRLKIVGDGVALAELKTLAASVYPNAEFLGRLTGAALADAFAQAELFVLPGLGGLAVQEAMSHALPVIVAEADGTQDDLVRPENGWMIPPANLDALTEKLRTALSDRGRLLEMGLASYRIVADEINIEKMVETLVRAMNVVTGKT